MQNLTATKNNFTDWECNACLNSPIIRPAVLPYVLISLPANVWVLWLMISSPVFWTDRMEVFDFHLVLSELLFGFLGQPLLTVTLFSNSEVAHVVSKVINTIFIARLQFQSCVCIERYFAVIQPVLFLRFKLLRYRMSFGCFIWLQTILFSIVQLFFCNTNPISVGMYISYFFIVFIVNSFCCISVLKALKQPSPGEGERERANLVKKRAFNIVLMFQVTMVVGYVPLVTMFFLVMSLDRETLCTWQPLAYAVMVWLGAIYPVLYLRKAWKSLPVRNYLCLNCFQE